ncbi:MULTISPECIES: hypothetical protein [unclassified Rhizobium]|uniref:hypothetical protein n=1 Tax=unclassified Rhizobium TaxID=2613769 RepID=UPI001FD90557|nr:MULTISPECIES: hypothetical protein [unclassified Rhizobium]
MHDEAAFGQTRLGDILIFTPFPDLDVAGQVSAMDRMSLSIVGIRDRRDAWKITKTAQGVREKMVQRIFSEMPEVMPRRAHPLAAGKGLWKRVFARPSVLIGDLEPNTVTAQAQHGSPRHHKPRFFTRRTPFLQIGDRSVAPPLAE